MKRAPLMLCVAALALSAAAGTVVRVSSSVRLRAAMAAARPGVEVRVAPGTYESLYVRDLHGTAAAPIVLAADDQEKAPVFRGRAECMHLTRVSYLVLRGLELRGARSNGLNIDDGGDVRTPSHHLVLDGLTVRDIGPRGNRDGIKLSGVDDFLVRGCTVERWGSGGSAVDMVGCHRGLFAGCELRHRPRGAATGIQTKGGSSDVVVYRCRFEHAGTRAINLGGSTGLPYFRPRDARYEARRVVAVGNTFVGSLAPVAFATSVDCEACYNTLYRPRKWVFRILQEQRVGPRFGPCRTGVFRRNLVVWRRGDVEVAVNVGPNTEPTTFRAADNWWYCEDAPARSRLRLAVAETGAVVGRDPGLKVDGLRITAAQATEHGAHAKDAARAMAATYARRVPWAYRMLTKASPEGGQQGGGR